jgi:hypothetical protein
MAELRRRLAYAARGESTDSLAARMLTNYKVPARLDELRAENRKLSSTQREEALDYLVKVV